MAFEEIIFLNEYTASIYFIFTFAILGGAVKYIDDAFDEKVFNKWHGLLLAPILGILWAFNMSLSSAAATILAAIVIGVFLTGKIDNVAHQIGFLSILGVLFVGGFVQFIWIPLIIIAFAGLIDEVGNDFVDKHREVVGLSYYFFNYRFTMKIAVMVFAYLGFYEWFYFLAFLLWDIAYIGIATYSSKLTRMRKFYYHKSNNNLFGLI